MTYTWWKMVIHYPRGVTSAAARCWSWKIKVTEGASHTYGLVYLILRDKEWNWVSCLLSKWRGFILYGLLYLIMQIVIFGCLTRWRFVIHLQVYVSGQNLIQVKIFICGLIKRYYFWMQYARDIIIYFWQRKGNITSLDVHEIQKHIASSGFSRAVDVQVWVNLFLLFLSYMYLFFCLKLKWK